MLLAAAACLSGPALAQSRSSDNAVTQAEDAFGFSVGRESLGIYNAGYARGFSPVAAGNLRINGLYFDQAYNLSGTILGATSVKVGLSAQGYPFAAPSGIFDQTLRTPADKAGASFVGNFDSNGTWGAELDGSQPLNSKLSLGYGVNATRTGFADGTSNWVHTVSLIGRWRPADGGYAARELALEQPEGPFDLAGTVQAHGPQLTIRADVTVRVGIDRTRHGGQMPAQAGDRPVAHLGLIDGLHLSHRALSGTDTGGERPTGGAVREPVYRHDSPPPAGCRTSATPALNAHPPCW